MSKLYQYYCEQLISKIFKSLFIIKLSISNNKLFQDNFFHKLLYYRLHDLSSFSCPSAHTLLTPVGFTYCSHFTVKEAGAGKEGIMLLTQFTVRSCS